MEVGTRQVTAKFIVQNISDMGYAKQVSLMPDYADGRNKEWAEATPAGSISLTIKNELAAEVFTQGRSFLVTFTPED